MISRLLKLIIRRKPEPEFLAIALDKDDPVYGQAMGICSQAAWCGQKFRISLLQRELNIGFNPAFCLMERMEREGIVSPPDKFGRRIVCRDADGYRPSIKKEGNRYTASE